MESIPIEILKYTKIPSCNSSIYSIPLFENSNDFNFQFVIKLLIGKNGSYFKYLTQFHNLEYLWYFTNTKNIQIWTDDILQIELIKKKLDYKIYKIIQYLISEHKLNFETNTILWLKNYKKTKESF